MTTAEKPKTLRELLEASPYTRKEVAEMMDISERMLYAWESGENKISVFDLHALLKIYGVRVYVDDLPTLIPTMTDNMAKYRIKRKEKMARSKRKENVRG